MAGRTSRGRLLAYAGGLACAALLVVGLIVIGSQNGASTTPNAASAPTAGSALRTVTLTTSPDAMSSANHLTAVLLSGTMPHGSVQGTVATDTNCEADAAGISHCFNDVTLSDGSVLHLRHNHPMMGVRCLTPGETVMVIGT
jgi:hypothetical protein